MQCTNPLYLRNFEFNVPCGKCMACKIAKTREWSIRLLHELTYHDKALFLTLTYSNENLPLSLSVSKRELQLFFKRLRKKLPKRTLKYFACGEYGGRFNRPHYHAIIYGIGLSQKDKELLNSCWNKGFLYYGTVHSNSIAYVTGYVSKKVFGKYKDETYTSKGLESPFQLQSLGLGLRYVDEHYDELKNDKTIRYKGTKCSLPRYYRQKLGLDSSDFAQIIEDVEFERATIYKEIHNHTTLSDSADLDRIYRNPKKELDLIAKDRLFNKRDGAN